MKLKSIFFALLTLLTLASSPVMATETPKEKVELTEAQKARISELTKRVETIKGMNRSKLSKAERKNLRKELKNINAEAKAIQGQGIYISLGALIIAVLLLIILL